MDLFGRQDQLLNGGLSSDSMFLSWPSLSTVTGGGVGLLIQQIGLEYRQPVRRVFEIGPGVIPVAVENPTNFGQFLSADFCDDPNAPTHEFCEFRSQPTYYIVGRPEGRLSMGRFVGPNSLTACFYRKYGSPCSSNEMLMSGKAGCSASDASARRMTWTLNGVLLDSVSMDVTGQEMVIQERIGAMFAGMNLAVEGDTGICDDVGQTGGGSSNS